MKLKLVRPSETGAQEVAHSFAKVSEVCLRKILVATDFSAGSQKAFHYAVSLARQYQAEVVILHVFEPPPPQIGILEGALMDTSYQEDAAQELEWWRRLVTPDIKTNPLLRDGAPPYKQIVAVAREVEADLIILGHHGRNALGRTFMGSTAEKVVRFAPCPVLVIRDREHDFVAQSP